MSEEVSIRDFNDDLSPLLDSNGYELLHAIGEGSSATVYLVKSKQYDELFVCKRIALIKCNDKISEIRVLMDLNHPNIIRLYNYFEDDNYIYLILEYCPGGSLADIIREGACNYSVKGALAVFQQIVAGLNHCHKKGIAHLDIKPANILIDKYSRIKLADFGLSKLIGNDGKLKEFRGSRCFMAPEVLLRGAYDPFKADIWSLGVTFYFLLTGQSPWPMKVQSEMEFAISMCMYTMPKGLDPILSGFIKSMMDISPESRPTTVELLENPILVDLQIPDRNRKMTVLRNAQANQLSSISSKNIQFSGFIVERNLPPEKKKEFLTLERTQTVSNSTSGLRYRIIGNRSAGNGRIPSFKTTGTFTFTNSLLT